MAEALTHTLNVGPMADDMCFLRCRETLRMRTRREEIRERKRMKRREGKKLRKNKHPQQNGGGGGGWREW